METVYAAGTAATPSTADEFVTAWNDDNISKIILKNTLTGVNLSGSLNRTLELDLSNYNLTFSNNTIAIGKSGNLTITGSGTVTSSDGIEIVVDGGTLTLKGGKLEGIRPTVRGINGAHITMESGCEIVGKTKTESYGVIVNSSSVFDMNGGTISDTAMGVEVSGGAKFTMKDGIIKDNISQGAGAGVHIVGRGSTFTMNGGSITGNQAHTNTETGQLGVGGGVAVIENSTFNMNGGSITKNTAQVEGGGVYVQAGSTFNRKSSETTISSNTAGNSLTNDIVVYSSSSSSSSSSTRSSSSSTTTRSSSSSSSSSGSSTSFSSGGVRTTGSGSAKADYTRSSSQSVKYEASEVSYKATSAKVPATAKIGGKTYAVTSIASGAFASYTKLKEITLGSNIKKIGSGAFDGCTNLKSLTINSKKLTAKNIKGAFKGSAIKTVYVPASKVDAYKKIFTKANTGSKGKITVKAKKTTKKK